MLHQQYCMGKARRHALRIIHQFSARSWNFSLLFMPWEFAFPDFLHGFNFVLVCFDFFSTHHICIKVIFFCFLSDVAFNDIAFFVDYKKKRYQRKICPSHMPAQFKSHLPSLRACVFYLHWVAQVYSENRCIAGEDRLMSIACRREFELLESKI